MAEKDAAHEAHSEMWPKSMAARTAFAVLGGLALYFLILVNFDIYRDMLSPYSYRVSVARGQFPWSWPMIFSVVLVSIVSAALTLAVPNHRSVVGVFSHTIFVVLFVPLCAIYTIMDGEFLFVFLCAASIAVCYFIFGKANYVSLYARARFDGFALAFFLSILVFALVKTYFSGQLSLSFVSFDDVYGLRSASSAGDSPVADRLVTIAVYISASYVLIEGMRSRNPIFVGFGAFSLYVFYSTFGFKLFLFYGLIVLSLYIFYTCRYPLLLLYSAIALFCFIFFVDLFDLPYISSFVDRLNDLIVRRYFYAPGYISFAWYETFSSNPLIYMSNVFLLNHVIDYPYDVNYSLVVSRFIFNMDFNPNTNVMGYGFANFGHVGIFLYAIFAFFFMWLIDFASYKVGSIYLRLGALAPATLFLEADLFVVMISFGFGLIVLIGLVGMLLTRTGKGVG